MDVDADVAHALGSLHLVSPTVEDEQGTLCAACAATQVLETPEHLESILLALWPDGAWGVRYEPAKRG